MDGTDHPPPICPARDVDGDAVPRGALTLAALAETFGWRVRITYARGTTIGLNNATVRVVDSYAVRLARGDTRLAAVWLGDDPTGPFKFTFAVSSNLRSYNLTQLKEVVRTP